MSSRNLELQEKDETLAVESAMPAYELMWGSSRDWIQSRFTAAYSIMLISCCFLLLCFYDGFSEPHRGRDKWFVILWRMIFGLLGLGFFQVFLRLGTKYANDPAVHFDPATISNSTPAVNEAKAAIAQKHVMHLSLVAAVPLVGFALYQICVGVWAHDIIHPDYSVLVVVQLDMTSTLFQLPWTVSVGANFVMLACYVLSAVIWEPYPSVPGSLIEEDDVSEVRRTLVWVVVAAIVYSVHTWRDHVHRLQSMRTQLRLVHTAADAQRIIRLGMPTCIINELVLGEDSMFRRGELSLLRVRVVDYDALRALLTPRVTVGVLHDLYTVFDTLAADASVHRVDVLGEEYLLSCGAANHNVHADDHALQLAIIAVAMHAYAARICVNINVDGGGPPASPPPPPASAPPQVNPPASNKVAPLLPSPAEQERLSLSAAASPKGGAGAGFAVQLRIAIHEGVSASGVLGVEHRQYCHVGPVHGMVRRVLDVSHEGDDSAVQHARRDTATSRYGSSVNAPITLVSGPARKSILHVMALHKKEMEAEQQKAAAAGGAAPKAGPSSDEFGFLPYGFAKDVGAQVPVFLLLAPAPLVLTAAQMGGAQQREAIAFVRYRQGLVLAAVESFRALGGSASVPLSGDRVVEETAHPDDEEGSGGAPSPLNDPKAVHLRAKEAVRFFGGQLHTTSHWVLSMLQDKIPGTRTATSRMESRRMSLTSRRQRVSRSKGVSLGGSMAHTRHSSRRGSKHQTGRAPTLPHAQSAAVGGGKVSLARTRGGRAATTEERDATARLDSVGIDDGVHTPMGLEHFVDDFEDIAEGESSDDADEKTPHLDPEQKLALRKRRRRQRMLRRAALRTNEVAELVSSMLEIENRMETQKVRRSSSVAPPADGRTSGAFGRLVVAATEAEAAKKTEASPSPRPSLPRRSLALSERRSSAGDALERMRQKQFQQQLKKDEAKKLRRHARRSSTGSLSARVAVDVQASPTGGEDGDTTSGLSQVAMNVMALRRAGRGRLASSLQAASLALQQRQRMTMPQHLGIGDEEAGGVQLSQPLSSPGGRPGRLRSRSQGGAAAQSASAAMFEKLQHRAMEEIGGAEPTPTHAEMKAQSKQRRRAGRLSMRFASMQMALLNKVSGVIAPHVRSSDLYVPDINVEERVVGDHRRTFVPTDTVDYDEDGDDGGGGDAEPARGDEPFKPQRHTSSVKRDSLLRVSQALKKSGTFRSREPSLLGIVAAARRQSTATSGSDAEQLTVVSRESLLRAGPQGASSNRLSAFHEDARLSAFHADSARTSSATTSLRPSVAERSKGAGGLVSLQMSAAQSSRTSAAENSQVSLDFFTRQRASTVEEEAAPLRPPPPPPPPPEPVMEAEFDTGHIDEEHHSQSARRPRRHSRLSTFSHRQSVVRVTNVDAQAEAMLTQSGVDSIELFMLRFSNAALEDRFRVYQSRNMWKESPWVISGLGIVLIGLGFYDMIDHMPGFGDDLNDILATWLMRVVAAGACAVLFFYMRIKNQSVKHLQKVTAYCLIVVGVIMWHLHLYLHTWQSTYGWVTMFIFLALCSHSLGLPCRHSAVVTLLLVAYITMWIAIEQEPSLAWVLLVFANFFSIISSYSREIKERTAFVTLMRDKSAEYRARTFLDSAMSRKALERVLPSVEQGTAVHWPFFPESYSKVTVLRCGIVQFPSVLRYMGSLQAMALLHVYFSTFDLLLNKYGLDKLQMTADADYFASGGVLGRPVKAAGRRLIDCALEFLQEMESVRTKERTPVSFKVCIHRGPVVAVMLGALGPHIRLHGDTMHTLDRAFAASVPNACVVSSQVLEDVKVFYNTTQLEKKVELVSVDGTAIGSMNEPMVETPKAPLSRSKFAVAVASAAAATANAPPPTSPAPLSPPPAADSSSSPQAALRAASRPQTDEGSGGIPLSPPVRERRGSSLTTNEDDSDRFTTLYEVTGRARRGEESAAVSRAGSRRGSADLTAALEASTPVIGEGVMMERASVITEERASTVEASNAQDERLVAAIAGAAGRLSASAAAKGDDSAEPLQAEPVAAVPAPPPPSRSAKTKAPAPLAVTQPPRSLQVSTGTSPPSSVMPVCASPRQPKQGSLRPRTKKIAMAAAAASSPHPQRAEKTQASGGVSLSKKEAPTRRPRLRPTGGVVAVPPARPVAVAVPNVISARAFGGRPVPVKVHKPLTSSTVPHKQVSSRMARFVRPAGPGQQQPTGKQPTSPGSPGRGPAVVKRASGVTHNPFIHD